MMNDITFNVLKIVVSVVAALMAVYLVPILKEKLKSGKYEELLAMVRVAVHAAEQTYKGESGMGRIKKENVIMYIQEWMADRGIQISDKQLSELIEACVYEMNAAKGGEK